MKSAQQLVGQYGEAQAARYLEGMGWQIIERNWRCNLGEIDLVAKRDERISVIEVKTRRGNSHGIPFEAITRAKAARLRLLAASWCRARSVYPVDLSIDAISVAMTGGRVHLEFLERIA